MNAEFHYYTTYYLATQAGLPPQDSYILSFSAQYVDHALVPYDVRVQGRRYVTVNTHYFGFWDRAQERHALVPFHFLPGDPEQAAAIRRDGAYNPFAVTANNARAKQLLVSALKSRNLYRIGIALHTFADTYAHQNFTGRNEAFNSIDDSTLVPPLAHAQIGRSPDQIGAVWEDPRLVEARRRVDNRKRFRACARKIYRYLCLFNGREYADEELVLDTWLERFESAARSGATGRDRILDFIIQDGAPEYHRSEWKNEALELDESEDDDETTGIKDKLRWLKGELTERTGVAGKRPVRGKPGFFQSHFYRWHEAARGHREEAETLLADLAEPSRNR